MDEVVPTFLDKDFLFQEDTKPIHTEADPLTRLCIGMYSVRGARRATEYYALAEQIDSEELADVIVEARIRRLQQIFKSGPTENIFVCDPFGVHHLKYVGIPIGT